MYKTVTVVPGLYKIFDEILVNAGKIKACQRPHNGCHQAFTNSSIADNKIRDDSMNTIKVDVDEENGTISIYNNGAGIPVQLHRKENVYVPELIFGHLLTSSNYDDDVKKVTGGRNGYGAKLCNIFSVMFSVETSNKESGSKFKQIFYDNMTRKDKAIISKAASNDYTKVTFKPDLSKFGMVKFDSDFISLLKKRVYDLSGVLEGVKVYLNNDLIKIRNFRDYMRMYMSSTQKDDSDKSTIFYERCNSRWEVGFVLSEGQFQQVSFVNSVCTSKGGTHVNMIADQIAARVTDVIKKKAKDTTIRSHQIKSYMWIFVKCLIENPTFDSQTKETMTLKPAKFGSKCVLSEDIIKKIMKSGIVDAVVGFARLRQEQQLKRSDGSRRVRLSGIPKLDDANSAGLRSRKLCTLILTEGDSAKALAVSGLSEVGRDEYGVFPLRGKLLNVRDASHKQILENAEISNIKQIIGLKQGEKYNSTDSLRYDRVMIMTDQDHDGSHIKGLLINLFDNFWPSLLQKPNFLVQFITPIIRVKKGNQEIDFYSIPEFEKWQAENNNGRGYSIKYYKGLGTSTSKDAKKYFSNIKNHVKLFSEAAEDDRKHLELAFSKKRADERKKWLSALTPDVYMDYNREVISITEFVNNELILFSMADNIRSIPSISDGLKPGQRKILFCCLKRNLTRNEIKVAQLSGYVSEHSAYHHGEASLQSTIVGLAQDFVGSNNLNLLEPRGQFGTRLQGGKDHAHARYIFTRLSRLCRLTFHPDDDFILKYLNEENLSIEPEWYIPIIPLVLCNGAEGIGTGWSTSIMNYNPMDLIENILRKIDGLPFKQIHPWYCGFNGKIEEDSDKYKITGIIKKIDDTTLNITELPIHCWTQTYKEYLETLITGTDKTPPFIKDFKEYHTDTSVDFLITLSPENMRKAEAEGLEKKFKLSTTKTTTNMVLFDTNGTLKKYDSVTDILEEFYDLRYECYEKRKDHLLSKIEKELVKLSNQARFVEEVISGLIRVQNVKKDRIVASLKERGYAPIQKEPQKSNNYEVPTPDENSTEVEATEEDTPDNTAGGYEYLLAMPIWTLTYERFEKLVANRDDKQRELDDLKATSPSDMWRRDLMTLSEAWRKHVAERKAISDDNIISNKKRKAINFKNGPKRSTSGASSKGRQHGGTSMDVSQQLKKQRKNTHSFLDKMSGNGMPQLKLGKSSVSLETMSTSNSDVLSYQPSATPKLVSGRNSRAMVIDESSDAESPGMQPRFPGAAAPENALAVQMDLAEDRDGDDDATAVSDSSNDFSDWIPGRDS